MHDELAPWETFADSFEEEERQVPVPADSLLGRAMAEYRECAARGEVDLIDPETFMVAPIPVVPDDE